MKHLTLLAAAAMAFGSMTFAGCNRDETGKTPGEKAGDAVQSGVDATTRAADKAADATTRAADGAMGAAKDVKDKAVAALAPSGADDVKGMRSMIEGVVQNALDANNFKTMTNHFVDADQKRLDATKPDTAALDTSIKAFKDNWQKKYNDAFKVMDNDVVFGDDFVKLAAAETAGQKSGMATVTASHGMPALMIPVVAQDGKWRVDVPDDVDAAKIVANLQSGLTALGAPDTWPADKTEAYRKVSHTVLMAVLNKM